MKKDICCLNFKGLFGYIQKRFGTKALDKLIKDALDTGTYLISHKSNPSHKEPVTKDHLADESYWISNELSLALLAGIKNIVPGPEPEQTAGEGAVTETLSNSDLFFSRVIGPRALAKRVAKVNARFNRTKNVSISRLTRNSAIMELHYKPGFQVTKDVCNWNLGIYKGIAQVSGARNVQVKESKCVVDGDDCCEFRVHWQAPGMLRRVSAFFLKRFTRGLVEEYEKIVLEREQLIEKLRASEEQYRLIIENQSDLVIKLDTLGRIEFVSQSFVKRFDTTEAQLVGKSFIPHVHKQDRKKTVKEIQALYHPPFEGKIEHRLMTDQGLCWVSWTGAAMRDDSGTVTAITGVGRDVTRQKQMADALQESESLFQLITQNTSALFSIHDFNGNYIFASPSHGRLGYNPEELVGQSGFTMMFEDDVAKVLQLLEEAQAGERSKASIEYRLKDKSGNLHYYQGAFDAVFDDNGVLVRIVSVAEDVSKLRKAQADRMDAIRDVAESRKLALVGQVAGKMAHDFNNILSIIMGNAELSLLECGNGDMKESFELILEQSIRGKNLTKNLIAFAKDQEPKQEFFSVNQKIELVLTLLKKDLEGIRVVREYGKNESELLADPGMIEHAMVNLIQNAVHAVSLTDDPELTIRTVCHDDRVEIEISDNGCGIPEKYLQQVFDPSFTLKGSKDRSGAYKSGIEGTGYGMANVRKYVEQHKGQISLHSDGRKGTAVTIVLPVIKKALTFKEVSAIRQSPVYREKHILLVEDEPAISDVQYRLLTNEPCCHQVDIAANGQIAVDLLGSNSYDLVSLDYILPGGINGKDVYDHIREFSPNLPVLFISGNIEFLESIDQLEQEDPHVGHLSKPCMNMDYINGINRLLELLEHA